MARIRRRGCQKGGAITAAAAAGPPGSFKNGRRDSSVLSFDIGDNLRLGDMAPRRAANRRPWYARPAQHHENGSHSAPRVSNGGADRRAIVPSHFDGPIAM